MLTPGGTAPLTKCWKIRPEFTQHHRQASPPREGPTGVHKALQSSSSGRPAGQWGRTPPRSRTCRHKARCTARFMAFHRLLYRILGTGASRSACVYAGEGEGHWAEAERQEGWGEAVSPNTGRAEEGRLGKHFRWKGLGVRLEKETSKWYPSV